MASSDTPNPLPDVRRVITKHEGSKSVIASDELVKSQAAGFPGLFGSPLWVTKDGVPTGDNLTDGKDPIKGLYDLVIPNGTSFRYTDLAPGAASPIHRTSSIDYNILISGELVHIVDEKGEETHLKTPGETLIQRGTLHWWRNPSDTIWARWVTVIIAAESAEVDGKKLDDVMM